MAEAENLADVSPMEQLSEQSLNGILRDIVKTIENSKSQIFDIYEAARAEVEESKKNLEEIKTQTKQTIEVVDELERQEQREKQNLVRVSSNFADYSEERIKKSYELVKDVQVRLGVAREKERQLRQQRDRFEIRLYNLQRIVIGAERLAMRISSVLGYLGSQLSDVVAQMEAATKNRFLSAAIIKAQEDERFRVSREIHDGPAQDVANLLFQASICERMIDIDPDEAKMNLQELRRQLKGCLTDIRQIIFDMRPMSLDDLGLVPAVKQLLMKMRERGILDATLSIEGAEATLPNHVEAALFRIVQEALNNVDRHAGTKKATVRMLFTEASLAILVVDEGSGFDMDEMEAARQDTQGNGHFGLLGMRERANIIGAQLTVTSAKGKGTKVHLKLPLKPEATPENPPSVKAAPAAPAAETGTTEG